MMTGILGDSCMLQSAQIADCCNVPPANTVGRRGLEEPSYGQSEGASVSLDIYHEA